MNIAGVIRCCARCFTVIIERPRWENKLLHAGSRGSLKPKNRTTTRSGPHLHGDAPIGRLCRQEKRMIRNDAVDVNAELGMIGQLPLLACSTMDLKWLNSSVVK
jgi:hypothetical protein